MNNFTPRAQQVLQLARQEADRFNHGYIGTEHLLLGLIALGEGIYLAIGVEENTRATALALQGLRSRTAAQSSPPES